jgi:hypothetical protein
MRGRTSSFLTSETERHRRSHLKIIDPVRSLPYDGLPVCPSAAPRDRAGDTAERHAALANNKANPDRQTSAIFVVSPLEAAVMVNPVTKSTFEADETAPVMHNVRSILYLEGILSYACLCHLTRQTSTCL